MRVFVLLICLCFCVPTMAQDSVKNPNSLEGTPFGKRLYVGGDLGLSFGNYTVINIAPIVGYKLNKKWSTGIGAKYVYYRENFPSYGWDYSTSMYGGSVFTKYLLNSVILHAEFETLNTEVREFLSTDLTRKWVPMGFIGAGYRQGMGGTYLQIMALYDVIDNPYSPYRGQYIFGPQVPIIIRGGIVIGL